MDTDEGKGTGKGRRRRGGRRRTSAKDKTIKIADSNLKELLSTMAKLLSQTAARTRTLWSILVQTVILSEDSQVVISMRAEGKAFAANVAALRDKLSESKKNKEDTEGAATAQAALRQVGPPAPHMAVAMLEGLVQMDIGRGPKSEVERYIEAWKTSAVPKIELCRLENAYEEGKVKIAFSITDKDLNKVIVNAFQGWGSGTQDCYMPQGQAPPGYLEDELSDWIGALEIK